MAEKTGSIALESDAWHLRTVVDTSVGVLVGLVLIRLTGLVVLDSIVAIGVAPIIIRAAYAPTATSYPDLVDHRLTDGEDGRVRQIIREYQSEHVRCHTLRTRRSGPEVFIDFSLVVDRDVPVELSHDPTDRREADLKTEFPRASVLIRVEPDSGTAEPASFCKIAPMNVSRKVRISRRSARTAPSSFFYSYHDRRDHDRRAPSCTATDRTEAAPRSAASWAGRRPQPGR
ncbi:MAG TPA: hypothetical protein HA263_08235 [Methanoregulaceae archaeon]|nr:hypothetical protein [Methanoregulaceae archaeon]